MAQIIYGANVSYPMKKKSLEPLPVVENPVTVVENQPVVEPVVENPVAEKSGNEGGTGEGEFIDHSVESGWKAKREKKKAASLPYGIKETKEL